MSVRYGWAMIYIKIWTTSIFSANSNLEYSREQKGLILDLTKSY